MERILKIGGIVYGATTVLSKLGISTGSKTGIAVVSFTAGSAAGIYAGVNMDLDEWKKNPAQMFDQIVTTIQSPLPASMPVPASQLPTQPPGTAK
jgi:hypothetical protein